MAGGLDFARAARPLLSREEILRLLCDGGKNLGLKAQARILAGGRTVAPALIDVLLDKSLWTEDSPGDGFASVHAVDLLADIGAADAIEPMLNVLRDTHWDAILHDRILVRLPSFGAAALEPVLRRLSKTRRGDSRDGLLSILADLKVRDERIYDLLVEQLRKDPDGGAMNLGLYGDPAALPLLSDAFDQFRVKKGHGLFEKNRPLVELKEAIELLGGRLNAKQAATFQRLVEEHSAITGQPVREEIDDDELLAMIEQAKAAAEVAPKPGRNDPCWCGSGRKYKKCHLRHDEGQ